MSSRPASGDFSECYAMDKHLIEERFSELIGGLPDNPPVIKEAISYCLLNGGKRLRPILCLWTHDLLKGQNRKACLDAGCAIESLHTYSLIHDDLPCMDDDDVRRGKPSCHKKFGEAIAILTGDALLTFCFELLSSLGRRWRVENNVVVELIMTIARAAGTGGLIAGQVLDLMGENFRGGIDMVEAIHRNKTAVLIAASMESGAIVAAARPDEREAVRKAGLMAGSAFQIIDDVLDCEADTETLGKTSGKDKKKGKLTYPSVAGMKAARRKARTLVEESKKCLSSMGRSQLLDSILDLFVTRKS